MSPDPNFFDISAFCCNQPRNKVIPTNHARQSRSSSSSLFFFFSFCFAARLHQKGATRRKTFDSTLFALSSSTVNNWRRMEMETKGRGGSKALYGAVMYWLSIVLLAFACHCYELWVLHIYRSYNTSNTYCALYILMTYIHILTNIHIYVYPIQYTYNMYIREVVSWWLLNVCSRRCFIV